MSTDLEVIEDAEYTPVQTGTLFGTDDPVTVIEKATVVASALMDAVKRHDADKPKEKRLVSVISGREFPKLECWTLLGSMLGVFPVLEGEPVPIEVAGVAGWKATVSAQTRDGSVVGRASALCMRSESNWRNRDEYALMSMAQTRAASKALSQPLRFVMVLAGLEGTPEAEMPPDVPPVPDVRHDGKELAKAAKSWKEWEQRMTELEIPMPMAWLQAAAEATGFTNRSEKAWGRTLSQKANQVLLHFSDSEPKSSLGFWDVPEIQEGFAKAFDGAVIELPQPPEAEEEK